MARSTRRVIVASAAFAIMIWFVAPADAQRGRDNKQHARTAQQGGSQRVGQAQQRSAPPQVRPQAAPPQQQARSRQQPAPQVRSAQVQRQAPLPPVANYGRPQAERQAPPPPANVARGGAQSRYTYGAQGTYQAPRNYSQPRAVPYRDYDRPYYEVRRPVFVQPYFTFRPRFSLGFGIQIGYPVAYPFRYYDSYGFYNFRIGVLPGYGVNYYGNRVGGLSFNIDPDAAAVFIDGAYVGVAADFSYGQMPLTLASGRHRVDLRAQGFMSVSFDITVVAGQVIPYAGTMPYER